MGNKRYKPSRYYMYNRIESFFKKYKHKPGKCLLVGDSLRGKGNNKIEIKNIAIINMLPKRCEIIAPPYPDVDIMHMPYENNTFDYVIADQVLEHVKKPWLASLEVERVLKPNGWAIITSCLMNFIHGVPEDYFRFTPDGLKILFENLSYIEQAEGFGNLNFINKALTGKFKVPVKPGTPLEKEVMINDNKNLYLTWIIGRK